MSEKLVPYTVGEENFVTMDRYMDIEVKRGLKIPPKILLGCRGVKEDFQGQNPVVETVLNSELNVKVEAMNQYAEESKKESTSEMFPRPSTEVLVLKENQKLRMRNL